MIYSVPNEVLCYSFYSRTTASKFIKMVSRYIKVSWVTEWNLLRRLFLNLCRNSISVSKTEQEMEKRIYKLAEQHRFTSKKYFLDIKEHIWVVVWISHCTVWSIDVDTLVQASAISILRSCNVCRGVAYVWCFRYLHCIISSGFR